VAIVQRWPLKLELAAGWADTTVTLPDGEWQEVLCGGQWRGEARLSELLAGLPVALLERARSKPPSTRGDAPGRWAPKVS
jgi:(1->4)-alpha-D-glucan 1-alpha-D-glucosylmutase